jgi:hypothetical protein
MRAAREALRYDDNIDLVDFMERVIERSSSAELDAAAQAVINAVDDVVIAKCGSSSSHGLTIYMPENADTSYVSDVGAELLAVTGWSDIYSAVWAA